MKDDMKTLCLDEIAEQYRGQAEGCLVKAVQCASYAFNCWSEESEEEQNATFGEGASELIYEAQFDVETIPVGTIIQHLSDEGLLED